MQFSAVLSWCQSLLLFQFMRFWSRERKSRFVHQLKITSDLLYVMSSNKCVALSAAACFTDRSTAAQLAGKAGNCFALIFSCFSLAWMQSQVWYVKSCGLAWLVLVISGFSGVWNGQSSGYSERSLVHVTGLMFETQVYIIHLLVLSLVLFQNLMWK